MISTSQSENSSKNEGSNMFEISSESQRYGGLIKTPFYKQIYSNFKTLLSYFDVVSKIYPAIGMIISFIRIIQFWGSSLTENSEVLYEPGSTDATVISIVSVLFHLLPVSVRNYIVLIVYVIIGFLFNLVYFISSFIYKKTSEIPTYVVYSIHLFYQIIYLILQPIAAAAGGKVMGELIMNKDNVKDDSTEYIVSIVFLAFTILFILYEYIFHFFIYTDTLLFRSESLASVNGQYQSNILLNTCLISFLTAMACNFGQIARIIFNVICIAIYISSLRWIVTGPAFLVQTHIVSLTNSAICGAINLLAIIILDIIGVYGNMEFMFASFALYFVSYFCVMIWYNKRLSKHLAILDEFLDTKEFLFKNQNQFQSVLISGFMYAHPAILKYDIFHAALEAWDMRPDIMTTYAKFSAIYPEDSLNIKEILAMIRSNDKYTNLILQISRLLKERERGLAGALKKKLNKIGKRLENVKRKLHTVWDFAIQGNISDMGPAINSAYKATEKCNTEIMHLVQEYPNNKHAIRIEARFKNEIRGDKKAFLECKNKITELGRGITVNTDIYRDAGLSTFPLLPMSKEEVNPFAPSQSITMESETADLDTESSEVSQALIQQSSNLLNQINEVSIPSITRLTTLYIIIFLVFGILPTVFFNLFSSTYVSIITEPLEYISSISHMRCVNFQIAAFGTRLVLEELPSLKPEEEGTQLLLAPNYFRYYTPSSLGNSHDTRVQLKVILEEVSGVVEGTEQIRNFETNNKDMDNVRSQIFGATINLSFSTNISYKTYSMRNSQDVLMDTANQAARLADIDIVRDTLNDPAYLNLIDNAMNFGNNMNTALELFIEYIKNKDTSIQNIMLIIMIVCFALCLIACIAIDVYAYFAISNDQREVYKCLTTLPKAVVSNAAEAQKTITKESGTATTQLNEGNKQEENILKVFSSAGETVGSTGTIIIMVCTVIAFVIDAVSIYLFIALYQDQSTLFADTAPHADYIYGCAGYMNGVFLALNGIILSNNEYPEVHPDVYYLIERVDDRMDIVRDYYQSFRYGKPAEGQSPYSGFSEAAKTAEEIIGCNVTEYQTTGERVMCSSTEEQLILFDILTYQLMQNFRDNLTNISSHDDLVSDLWAIGPVGLYDSLFFRMFENLLSNIRETISADLGPTTAYASICIVVMFVFIVVNLIELQSMKRRLMFTLRLLLHCDMSAVMTSSKVQSILANNFKSFKGDSSLHDEDYFLKIVEKLTDAVMWTSNDGKISYFNTAATRTFGLEKEEIIGKTIPEFFNEKQFKGKLNFGENKTKVEAHLQYINGDSNVYIFASISTLKDVSIITCIDETQRVNYNTLIEEESAKSDRLLSSILPSTLVKRVKEGETNISFAVQSCSVLFLDIVSFTPWCGSNTAQYIMMVLNRLYKDLDSIVHNFPTMTKIKCIGDCYMAAGGIFSEVNQPAVHAKETVEFGLGAIKTVGTINADLNEKIQIRVGINTGGPIVAGVLGTDKPTFEILGPAINLAQQMEHHGVPMKVHISRHVYELIYGGSFIIKEKGETEVKHGSIMTYLVEGMSS